MPSPIIMHCEPITIIDPITRDADRLTVGLETIVLALERWHDDEGHHGALVHCARRPCADVADILRNGPRP